MNVRPWLLNAAALLREPDPGPTPWLVEGLIVERSLTAAVGRWKTTKTYALLDVAISIASARPALGLLEVAAGPVVFVLEESGRDALWRRLDQLCRGRAIDIDELEDLHVAPNARVRLDDKGWQRELLAVGQEIKPRAFVFDPLARMRSPSRDENATKEMAPLIEFLRELRNETNAAPIFVQHQGHQGSHMRGASDLESVWESRIGFERDAGVTKLTSQHREADDGPAISYRLAWDPLTRSMRLDATLNERDTVELDRLLHAMAEHPDSTADELRQAVRKRKADTLERLESLEESGNAYRTSSERRDRAGRARVVDVWNACSDDGSPEFPEAGNAEEPVAAHTLRGPKFPALVEPERERGAAGDVDEDEIERLAAVAREVQA